MTAERRPKAAPRLDPSSREWKLWLAAALGAIYTLSWFAFETHSPPPTAARPEARRTRVAEARPARARATRVRTRSS